MHTHNLRERNYSYNYVASIVFIQAYAKRYQTPTLRYCADGERSGRVDEILQKKMNQRN